MKASNALKWSFIGQITYILLYFVFNVLLSRILPPSDFGIFAIINTFIIFFSLIKDFGLGNYLIVKKDVTKELCDNIFYFNFLFTAVLFLLIYLVSPLIADFYNDDRLTILIRISGLTFIIDAFATVPSAMMTRNMNFFGLFIVKTVSVSIAGVVALIFANNGWGIYSLVFQTILLSVISCVVLFFFYPFRPGINFKVRQWGGIIKFSLPLFLNQFFQYFSRNSDNLIIGRIFGSYALGIYNRAYTLMQMPMQNISSVVSGVLLPVLAKSSGDPDRKSMIYKRAILGIAFATFPIMTFVFVFAREIILFLYGSAWVEVADLLMIFSIVGMLETIISPIGTLLMSAGKTTKLFKFSTLIRLFIIAMIVVGSFFSVKGVAICYLIATVLIFPYTLFYTAKQLEKPFGFLAKPLFEILVVTTIGGVIIYFFKLSMPIMDLTLLLMLAGSIFFCIYIVTSYFLTRGILKDCVSLITKKPL